MLIVLSIILIMLILAICGDKGSKSIVTTVGNALLLLLAVFLIYRGINPVPVSLIMSVLASLMILFFQNEKGRNSEIAFWSTVISIAIVIPLVFYLAHGSNSQGFNPMEYEITDSNGYTRNVSINMISIQIAVMIIALIGAAVDTAVAVTTSMVEIYDKNTGIEEKELIKSGFNVGKSILNTSMHTIFYIYIAEYMTLMMQYVDEYSFIQMINAKSFSSGFLSITICGSVCCIIVPISVILTSTKLYHSKERKKRFFKNKKKKPSV